MIKNITAQAGLKTGTAGPVFTYLEVFKIKIFCATKIHRSRFNVLIVGTFLGINYCRVVNET